MDTYGQMWDILCTASWTGSRSYHAPSSVYFTPHFCPRHPLQMLYVVLTDLSNAFSFGMISHPSDLSFNMAIMMAITLLLSSSSWDIDYGVGDTIYGSGSIESNRVIVGVVYVWKQCWNSTNWHRFPIRPLSKYTGPLGGCHSGWSEVSWMAMEHVLHGCSPQRDGDGASCRRRQCGDLLSVTRSKLSFCSDGT